MEIQIFHGDVRSHLSDSRRHAGVPGVGNARLQLARNFARKVFQMSSCTKTKLNRAVTVIVAALLFLVISGCTEIERQGYSPIPQNSPGNWELNPYNF